MLDKNENIKKNGIQKDEIAQKENLTLVRFDIFLFFISTLGKF